MICALISAPTPQNGCDSSATTTRLVFFTELMIVSVSSGRIVRGSMTSQETPCFCNSSAACEGMMTLRPGKCAYQDSSACECCEETWKAEPLGPRKTMGILNCPPDM